MSKHDSTVVRWLEKVEEHDFDAARAYLSLRYDTATAERLVRGLRQAHETERRANDILRACDRPPLPFDDPGVRRTLAKILRGEELSPILVVSYPTGADVADGYHRVSAVYHMDPFADVPLRIAAG